MESLIETEDFPGRYEISLDKIKRVHDRIFKHAYYIELISSNPKNIQLNIGLQSEKRSNVYDIFKIVVLFLVIIIL